MGSGEFEGGGSVKWKIKHSRGNNGHGDPNGGNGRDRDPVTGPGFFVVYDNGKRVYSTENEGHTIRIEWGPESNPGASTLASTSPTDVDESK